jgi:hypothetical protein
MQRSEMPLNMEDTLNGKGDMQSNDIKTERHTAGRSLTMKYGNQKKITT